MAPAIEIDNSLLFNIFCDIYRYSRMCSHEREWIVLGREEQACIRYKYKETRDV